MTGEADVVHIQCHYMVGEYTLYEAEKRGIRVIATNHFMPANLDPFLPFPRWFKDIVAKNSWKDMGKVMGRPRSSPLPRRWQRRPCTPTPSCTTSCPSPTALTLRSMN
ncbi:hypothetical protein GCM10017708_39040 [Arthrobacter citreus]